MFKKHYKLFSGILLAAIAVGWIIFLEATRPEPVKQPDAKELVQATADRLQNELQLAEQNKPKPTKAPAPTDAPIEAQPEVTPTESVTPTPAPEYTRFDYILANVSDSMNIRSGAGSDKSIVGKLGANAYAKIIERGSEWFKVKSGSITGYVSTKYIYTDNECIEKMRSLNALKIQINAKEVNIRAQANTECEIVATTSLGAFFDYYPEYSSADFYAIKYNDKICYVSSKLAEVNIQLKTASKS
ncbi:MAG: SH3 domain-containing protein [Lachnospiraceae bacterium]|nr:SH3 domain-containing protein [Lachnospiraceae bacterium]